MKLPNNLSLPFFAYGIFKPGQLGFIRVKDLVLNVEVDAFVDGALLERDGLPIIDRQERDSVRGAVLYFRSGSEQEAYNRIVEVEPEEHYTWGVSVAKFGAGSAKTNVLFGRSPQKGSVLLDEGDWDGRKDPLFTSALQVVDETLSHNQQFDWDLKPLFRLQMAYLLLWSAIERYVSLRYHLGDKVVKKIERMAEEEAFGRALRTIVTENRSVFRADRPTERVDLNPHNPKGAIDFYYQIRSNITHRGKAVTRDFDIVQKSLTELSQIFHAVLNQAFEDAGNCD